VVQLVQKIRVFGKEKEKPRKDGIRNHVKYTMCKILPARNTVPAVVLVLINREDTRIVQ
jgi:hypothetical protein